LDKQLDGASDPRSSSNELAALELQDHLMDGWRGDAEEGLHVGLCRRPTIQDRVGVNEGEVLALFLCVGRTQGIPIKAKS
jgi:hypothetical protein